MVSKLPLVIILGATGSGKTKLSLELAKKFGGQIISADSMQIYKGLDIITAKASLEERKIAPHHLIDELQPNQPFSVVDFRNKALCIIDTLFSGNVLPIVVGGTNYYIESLLWKILVEEPGVSIPQSSQLEMNKLEELSTSELYKLLLDEDPNRACKLHPNDKRKILSSLEIFYRKGRKHSDILSEQQTSEGGSAFGGSLRFENALIFWMICEQVTLDHRLDTRVDQMIEQGLVNELLDFHKRYNEKRMENKEVDYTKGIFQSIGFKEFHKYLMLSYEEKFTENGKKIFETAVDDLKRVTRRYAKKQKRWVLNRLLNINTNRKVPPVYSLDTTDISKWDECVSLPAISIVQSFLERRKCSYLPLSKQERSGLPISMAEKYFCNSCGRVFIGKFQWNCHIKSRRHKRVLQKKNKAVDS
ncbi:hypothetical protein RI129_011250 [Pyrocoelia pectoralis]|uniref:C2H2-type domain-containing protein n=1 Tax=Pyrocoelia pectoralis TaxID=417401 RepID=A0AAN7VAU1_9COLE